MPSINLENQEDLLEYKQKYSKILMQFSASWCGPCTRITPQIKNKIELLGRTEVLYIYIDIDKHRLLSNHFEIKSIPSFCIYDKESDTLAQTVTTSDINELTKYCGNNGIPLTNCSY